MTSNGESLHRKVLEKNMQNRGVEVTTSPSDRRDSVCHATLNSHVASTLNREHEYVWAAIRIWKSDPEPEKLFDIKQWKRWLLQIAKKRGETDQFYNEEVLAAKAKLCLGFVYDNNLKFKNEILQLLDVDQSRRLERCIELHEEKECAAIARLANSADSSTYSFDEDDEVEDVTPTLIDGMDRTVPLKPSNINPTSPQCSRESNSQHRIFQNLYYKGKSSSHSSTDALSRRRNKRSNGTCTTADTAVRKKHRSGDGNKPPPALNIKIISRQPRNLLENFKQNPPNHCIQDENNQDRPKCIQESTNDDSTVELFENSQDFMNVDDVVIENPTPPCSPPCILAARPGETEISRRRSYSGSFKQTSQSPIYSTAQRRDSFSVVQNQRRASESKLAERRDRKIKGIRTPTKEPLSLTQSVENNTQPLDDNFELPDLDLPDVDATIDQDKENYPVSIDEIDVKYPKPPTAPALTLEMFEELKKALERPPKEKIVTGFSLYILQEDLAVYNKDTEWLNDRNIDFYLELIKERSNRPGYPKVYIFHSFFYTLLTDKDGGYEVVQETTGEDDIFKYDIVFFPVNLNQHWRLVVVKFNEKSLKCYDSMKHDNSDVMKSLAKYLRKEYHRKYRSTNGENDRLNGYSSEDSDRLSPLVFSSNGEPLRTRMFFDSSTWIVENVASETIPQQKNAIDCGVFVLQYAEYLSRGKDFDFDQSHIPYFRKRMMYETLTKQLLTSAAPPGNENLEKP